MTAQPLSLESRLWTVDDLQDLPEGELVELYDGVLVEMPSPNLRHQKIVALLHLFLAAWKAQNGGEIFLSPVDLYVSPTKYFIPDLVFYGRETLESADIWRDPQRLTVAPDLVVEIASPSTAGKDRVEKVREYAAFGVPNYWIISPEDQSVQAMTLRDDLYVLAQVAGGDEEWTPDLFPDFSLSLTSLWSS